LGWPVQYSDIKHPVYRSPDVGDGGIQAQFVPPPTAPIPSWGFEQTYTQPPHFRAEVRGAIVPKDDGIQFPLVRFFPLGWPTQYSDIKHPVFRTPDIGSAGIDAKYIFVPPPFTLWGWDAQPVQPPHPWWERRQVGSIIGDAGIVAALRTFYPHGWPTQYQDIRHRRGLFKMPEFGDPGIAAKFIPPFVPIWGFQQDTPETLPPPYPNAMWRAGGIQRAEELILPLLVLPRWVDDQNLNSTLLRTRLARLRAALIASGVLNQDAPFIPPLIQTLLCAGINVYPLLTGLINVYPELIAGVDAEAFVLGGIVIRECND
jgi:hypothetical protein